MELNPSANAAVSMSRFSIVFPFIFFLPAMEFLQDVECYTTLDIVPNHIHNAAHLNWIASPQFPC